MSDSINIHIRGFIAVVFGVIATLGLLWLSQVLEAFPCRVAALGPLMMSYGLGATILGDRVFGSATGLRNMGFRWIFSAVGGLAGWFLAGAAAHGDFPVLEGPRQAARERAGKHEKIVTREEVDTAIQEVSDRAAELQHLRAVLNTSDAAAVKQFDQDVASYTQRNREVGDLKAKYEARLAEEAVLKAGLMGTWRHTFTVEDEDSKKGSTSVSVYSTYTPDGRARVEKAANCNGKAYRAYADAHWELTGKRLRVTIETASPESGEHAGRFHEFLLREITETQMHCLDLTAGAEIVCQRVSM